MNGVIFLIISKISVRKIWPSDGFLVALKVKINQLR